MTLKPWRHSATHRSWLLNEAQSIFEFFQFSAVNPKGGFYQLDDDGLPLGDLRVLHETTRMVHCMTIGHLMGRPGCDALVDHGMKYIWQKHRDLANGGYFWSLNDAGPVDSSKQAYGHAFVLLAASSAKCIGHPLADRMIEDATNVLNSRFWDETHGAVAEEFTADWQPLSSYRGQNSNMHLTEALMGAFEATGDAEYLRKAERISSLIIGKHAASLDYRVAEHFDTSWNIDDNYRGDPMFRPPGGTPGHWLEWARLLTQLWHLGGRQLAWLPKAAERLFANSVTIGWDHDHGGFYYTTGWDNAPLIRTKLWWPACEGIGAAHFLAGYSGDPLYEEWYRRIWGYCNNAFIDHEAGAWFAEVDDSMKRVTNIFTGKPDIYHSLQACVIPLYPATASLTRVIAEAE